MSNTTGEVQGNSVTITPGTTACTIVLTATLTGYNDATADITVNMIERRALVFASPPAYSDDNTLALGIPIAVSSLPASDDNTIGVTWGFAAAGTRNGSTQAGVCTVESDSQSDAFGTVTPGSSAEIGDVCTVTITGTPGDGSYNTWTQTIILTLRQIRPVQISVNGNHNCVRFEGGQVKCWGENTNGELGLGDANHRGGR